MSPDAPVHVIDDDEAVRDSLKFLLTTSGRHVRTYDSAEAFLATVQDEVDGIVITDIRMPGMSGIELLKRLSAAATPPPVIVITGHADVPLAVEAMKCGAADFLQKPFEEDQLLASLAACQDVQRPDAAHDEERAAVAARYATLSPREREVMAGLVAGHANKMIAYDLGISARTVEVYRAHVMTKMQARSLPELVRMGIGLGI